MAETMTLPAAVTGGPIRTLSDISYRSVRNKLFQYVALGAAQDPGRITYHKSKHIASALDLTPKEVGVNMGILVGTIRVPGGTVTISKWGYSRSTTWRVAVTVTDTTALDRFLSGRTPLDQFRSGNGHAPPPPRPLVPVKEPVVVPELPPGEKPLPLLEDPIKVENARLAAAARWAKQEGLHLPSIRKEPPALPPPLLTPPRPRWGDVPSPGAAFYANMVLDGFFCFRPRRMAKEDVKLAYQFAYRTARPWPGSEPSQRMHRWLKRFAPEVEDRFRTRTYRSRWTQGILLNDPPVPPHTGRSI